MLRIFPDELDVRLFERLRAEGRDALAAGAVAEAARTLGRALSYLNEITDLVRAGAQVIDDDNGADLAEQLGALSRSRLDRLIADVKLGHQILQQIHHTIPGRSQVDAMNLTARPLFQR